MLANVENCFNYHNLKFWNLVCFPSSNFMRYYSNTLFRVQLISF